MSSSLDLTIRPVILSESPLPLHLVHELTRCVLQDCLRRRQGCLATSDGRRARFEEARGRSWNRRGIERSCTCLAVILPALIISISVMMKLELYSLSLTPPISIEMDTIASNPTERAAFLALLDEYFYSHSPTPSTSAYQKPAIVLPTPVAPTPPSSYVPANKSNALAEGVLSRPGVSAALLKKGGIESNQANAMSKFGAKHSEVLAPHLASAATQGVKSGWAARNGAAGAAESEKVKGPIMPTGLSSGKKIGSISLNSGPEVSRVRFQRKRGKLCPNFDSLCSRELLVSTMQRSELML